MYLKLHAKLKNRCFESDRCERPVEASRVLVGVRDHKAGMMYIRLSTLEDIRNRSSAKDGCLSKQIH